MMKFLFRLFVLFVILIVVAWIGLMATKPFLDQELQKLIQKTQGRNVEVSFLDYGKTRLSRSGIIFNHIRARGVTRIQHPYFEPREFELSIKQIHLSLEKFSRKSLSVDVFVSGFDAKGGRILNEDQEDHERLESVTGLDFQTELSLEGFPSSWKPQLMTRAKQLKAWVFNDQPIKNLEIKGRAVFIVDDWPVSVRFHSVASADGLVHLEGNAEDLRVIAEMIEPKFTDSDLNLAAKNLLKAPRLLSIRTQAEMRAIHLKNRDPQISYDVPRHIFWSYWLTQAYGPDFAREATNSHEVGDMLNSAAESQKDRHHNELGIEYATRRLSEEQVEKLIFTDPRVVRLKKKSKMKNPVQSVSSSMPTASRSHAL